MVVLGPVPAKDGGNVVVRLDHDPAPAPRPLGRAGPAEPVRVLPGVFAFAAGSLPGADVYPLLAPKRAVRGGTLLGDEKLDPVIEFLGHAPRVKLVQRAPLVGGMSSPVVRDASESLGGCGVDRFGLLFDSIDTLLRFSEYDGVNAVFIGRCNRRCNGWNAEDRKHRHDTTEVENALVGTENTRGLYMKPRLLWP